MGILKKTFAAIPVALAGAAVATNIPALKRYLKIRSHSRDERPKGVTTTPRSYVTGRRP